MNTITIAALAIPALFVLYIIGIQYERGGWWRLVAPVTVMFLMLNVLLNYTLLALITWDLPRRGETTFSRRLKRLQFDLGWRGKLALAIKPVLDRFDPDGVHI
jgi:hypothetical protein